MLKDITLGQYFPGNTVVHKLDPRTKILLVVVYIIGLFQANGWAGYAAVTGFTCLCTALSKIRPAAMFKGVKPMGRAGRIMAPRTFTVLLSAKLLKDPDAPSFDDEDFSKTIDEIFG